MAPRKSRCKKEKKKKCLRHTWLGTRRWVEQILSSGLNLIALVNRSSPCLMTSRACVGWLESHRVTQLLIWGECELEVALNRQEKKHEEESSSNHLLGQLVHNSNYDSQSTVMLSSNRAVFLALIHVVPLGICFTVVTFKLLCFCGCVFCSYLFLKSSDRPFMIHIHSLLPPNHFLWVCHLDQHAICFMYFFHTPSTLLSLSCSVCWIVSFPSQWHEPYQGSFASKLTTCPDCEFAPVRPGTSVARPAVVETAKSGTPSSGPNPLLWVQDPDGCRTLTNWTLLEMNQPPNDTRFNANDE